MKEMNYPNITTRIIYFGFYTSFFLFYVFRSQHRIELLDKLKFQQNASVIQNYEADYPEPNPLDGCLHVFIDLGSNRGLQIRKLYEPHNFPLAPVLPLYEKYFGKVETRSLSELCSVSFEPNSKHAAHLRGMAEAYGTCGINMLVMEAGVGHKDTVLKFAPFNQMYGHEVEHDASARLIHEEEGETMEAFAKSHLHSEVEIEEVEVVRFAKFITETVAKRRLPTSAEVIKPSVVIKADIEGAELKILPDMIMTGALQHVDNLHMEWHGEASYRTGEEPKKIDKLEKAITVIAELAESEGLEDKFDIIEMDDETYSGILVYKPWGDYSEIPMMTC